MIVDPRHIEENSFKGKLNLNNIRQFYQIFFPSVADRLSAISPAAIRESTFINGYLDLLYDPGKVTINGVELTGAFNFEGLLDFHGL